MSRVWDRRAFEYREVDILADEHTRWKELYVHDIPVVHVDRTAQHGDTTAAARKLKHRFTEQQLEKVMDDVERA
ncbi:Glutaredoxin-like protein [Cercospora zeina]